MPAKYVDPFENDLPDPDSDELYSYIIKILPERWEEIELNFKREGIGYIWLEWTETNEPRVLITKYIANILQTMYDIRMDGPYYNVSIQSLSDK